MFKVNIEWYKLRTIAKDKPELIKILSGVDDKIVLEALLEDKGYHTFEHYVNSLDDLPEFLYEYVEIKPLKRLKIDTNDRIVATELKELVKFNQVHLPGNELLSLKTVKVLEDACTEEINQELEGGWRIVAVLPQLKQRRPDYILGKTD